MLITQNVFELLKPMPPFIEPLRRANRANTKTQTRRVIHLPDDASNVNYWTTPTGRKQKGYADPGVNYWTASGNHIDQCPYGLPGDIRYMREPLYRGDDGYARYLDDNLTAFSLLDDKPIEWKWKKDVLAQLYMPKVAARTFKRYDFIRVERLLEISEEDAIHEGAPLGRIIGYGRLGMESHREGFLELWHEINGSRGYGIDVNPWVWVIGYEQLEISTLTPALSLRGEGEKAEI